MMLDMRPFQRSLSDFIASGESVPLRPPYISANSYSNSESNSDSNKKNYCYCITCSMGRKPDLPFNYTDSSPDSLFIFKHSSSTLLSQASSPSPMDPMLPVRVESIDQPDELAFGNYSLFNDYNFSDEFIIDDDNGDDTAENIKENISVESLLLNGLTCSQLSSGGGGGADSQILSQPLSQSQRSQNSQQRSQENPNVLQVKSLDNSILSSSYENYSQPLVIASQSSYHGSSIYGSTNTPTGTQSLTQTDSQEILDGSCCRKHQKYFEKLASKTIKRIEPDLTVDIATLYKSTHNGYLKPPFSHNLLCALAILSVPSRQQEVSGVYRFLTQCFPYFSDAGQHWKNSLRHSLATCGWFEKSEVPRTAKKGYKYTVSASQMDCLRNEIKKQGVTDLTKLTYRLSGPYVCEYLLNMGLLALGPNAMAQVLQSIRASY